MKIKKKRKNGNNNRKKFEWWSDNSIEWISVIMNLIALLRLESSNICITIRLERLNRFKKRKKKKRGNNREKVKQLIRN